MANDFVDTSTLVKYYHVEDGTQEVTRLLEEPAARRYISRLSLRDHRRVRRQMSHTTNQ
jgi:hypothetical protein